MSAVPVQGLSGPSKWAYEREGRLTRPLPWGLTGYCIKSRVRRWYLSWLMMTA